METPLLYRQLHDQLGQWASPQDRRHLQGVAEAVAAILQSQSAVLGKWIPYLSHRGCSARAHLERLAYLLHNDSISAERFYVPLLQAMLEGFEETTVTLVLDTSMLWDQFCLIEVCLAWGGRSLTLAQVVLEHGSATVGFADYREVLETAKAVLPAGCQVMFLADRGFQHRELLRWLQQQGWHWALRVKSDLQVTLVSGNTRTVAQLLPPVQQAYLFEAITVGDELTAHLATAHVPIAGEAWAVLSNQSPSLQTFALYGERFGGIEPHFKDYKSAAFEVLQSGLREAPVLTRLFMLLDTAYLIAVILGVMLVQQGRRAMLDWHGQRGLSLLQLGLRECARLSYHRLMLPLLKRLPQANPPPACASKRKRETLDTRIEFSKVVRFSA
ncbi:MAG: transposase [Leptolyngbya sp. SIO1E4]|nr:transposase [Leptolyngbya sp. SIO1E4]MBE7385682.1 transposase [Leptolyngbya sp. SIO1E4]